MRLRTELLTLTQEGRLVGTGNQRVDAFLGRWVAEIAPKSLRPRTVERYTGIVQRHLIPCLGHLRLAQLSPQHIDRLHVACGRVMKPASVLAVHACLRSALRYALVRRLIERNPADGASPPRAKRPTVSVLGAADCRRLLESVNGDELEALYVLAVTTGARLGELLGLRWIDIDLPSARIAIRHALLRTGGRWSLDEPKSDRARRSVALGRRAVRAIQVHRARQQRRRLAAGPAWTDHDLVFTDDWGEPLYGAHVTERHFKPLLKRAGLPLIRFHDLRHTAATLMLGQGVNPKIVSEMLGHASVVLTLDTYSHVIPSMQAIVVEQMDLALG